MAKNKSSTRPMNLSPDYARQQENIRKAKGNPNKNIHHKKNGSNYGGVDYVAQKKVEKEEEKRPRREPFFDLTPTGRVIFVVMLIAVLVIMILGSTTLKGNPLANYLPSLLVGLICCFLAYNGFLNRSGKKKTTFQTVIQWALTAFGFLYTFLGAAGLLGLISR
jgi:hypothetical protein